MHECLFCGLVNNSEAAKFCSQCGPTGPARDWRPEDIDRGNIVTQYVSMLSEFYFDLNTQATVNKFSLRMREKFQISHQTHSLILNKLEEQKKAIAHFLNFSLEFNENLIDAYAGHDTFLKFRFTNLSEEDIFKVKLLWDNSQNTKRTDLQAETKNFVRPKTSVTIGSSLVFDRIGIKEISDLQITLIDQFGESVIFRVETFGFLVGSHEQRLTQNITTNTQISIEGRGVIDASGIGVTKSPEKLDEKRQPRWKEVKCIYIPQAIKVLDIEGFGTNCIEKDPIYDQTVKVVPENPKASFNKAKQKAGSPQIFADNYKKNTPENELENDDEQVLLVRKRALVVCKKLNYFGYNLTKEVITKNKTFWQYRYPKNGSISEFYSIKELEEYANNFDDLIKINTIKDEVASINIEKIVDDDRIYVENESTVKIKKMANVINQKLVSLGYQLTKEIITENTTFWQFVYPKNGSICEFFSIKDLEDYANNF
jgi:hypothetical protein